MIAAPVATDTERATALARSLLARHGVLTREAVHAEGIEGGFSSIYGVLKAMEESSQVRRGYFVEGLGATQFAVLGAEERLRALREDALDRKPRPPVLLLAATDPANPYGAALPWPDRAGAHPQRSAGAQVLLFDGALLALLSRGDKALTTYLPEKDPERSIALDALADSLASLIEDKERRAVLLERIDGLAASDSPLAPAFEARGFTAGQKGLFKRRPFEPG